MSNIDPPTFPDGLDVEVFSRRSLEAANLGAQSDFDKSMLRRLYEMEISKN